MIHHPNQMGFTDDKLFGLILDDYFHNSKFQNFGCGCCKMKTGLIFKNSEQLPLNFHDLSSKPSRSHEWQTVWLDFG